MTKATKTPKETSESEGTKFREGYYKHHGLGEGRMCTNEENKECMKVVLLVRSGKIAECEGQQKIRQILDAQDSEVPF